MKIINTNNNSVFAANALIADSPFKRMKGLLGRKVFNEGEALIIKPSNSIHTLFMRFPVDILFVNKKDRIIKVIRSLKPFRITGIYFNANYVVELPAGTIQKNSLQEGDTISIS